MDNSQPNLSENDGAFKTSETNAKVSLNQTPDTSATTQDIPTFGWSHYAERINGRFAMVGFAAILLIEAFSHETFLQWAGLIK